ncbi:MAG: hypothetical protein OES24_03520 [Acidimicrobiia bacterium]|nr:hypothetical protein [Acidimicrobiia bacterium]
MVGHGQLQSEALQVIPDHVPPDHVAPDQVPPDHVAPDQVAPDQVAPDQVAPDQVVPDQVVPDQVPPDQVAPLDDLIAAACERVPRNITQEEWVIHFGDEPYRRTCPSLPLAD